jgi:hypothetical protein
MCDSLCGSHPPPRPSRLVGSPPMHDDSLRPEDPVPSLDDGSALPRDISRDDSSLVLAVTEDASPCVLEDDGCAGPFRGREEAGAEEGKGACVGACVEDVRSEPWGDKADCWFILLEAGIWFGGGWETH